jgi:PAS domain S-box-containing protein
MGKNLALFGRRRDGSEFPVEISLGPIRTAEGVLVASAIRDMTERRELEAALRLSEERFHVATAGSSNGLWDWSLAAGGKVWWSPLMFELLGYELDAFEPSYSGFQEMLHPEDVERMVAAIQDHFQRKLPYDVELRIKTASGKYRWFRARGQAVWDAQGEPVRMAGSLQDVQALKEAELALREEAKQKARLADIGAITAKIVHDLGNPIAGLSMQAQLIRRCVERGDAIEELREPANLVLSTTKYLNAVIGEFRNFARVMHLELGDVDLPALLEGVATFWRPVAAERKVRVKLRLEGSVSQLRADEAKLKRVLDNLVKNGVEAVDQGPGEVLIEARPGDPGRLLVCVADTGPGIPPGVRLFELFETTKPQGTGLGLAVSRQIVEAHGGGIGVIPRKPCGTIFRIDLPLAGPAV